MSDLVGKKFNVLDHGHVVLMDYMGNDEAIVQAARTSYQKGTKKVSDDRGLIRYLMRHRHSTPFESCVVKLHVKLPIFVERQWARHRTFGWNEVSARYSELPEEYYIPRPEDVCAQSKVNKQGRDEPLDEGIARVFNIDTMGACIHSFGTYHDALKSGVARELARIGLPLGTYTEKVWYGNLHNLLGFLQLRMDPHAQWEIRQYANVIGQQLVSALFPFTWEAFQDYRLNAITLSGPEIEYIRKVMLGDDDPTALPKREQEEVEAKIKRLGLLEMFDG